LPQTRGGAILLNGGAADVGSSGGSLSLVGGSSDSAKSNGLLDGTVGGDIVLVSGRAAQASGSVFVGSASTKGNGANSGSVVISTGDVSDSSQQADASSGSISLMTGRAAGPSGSAVSGIYLQPGDAIADTGNHVVGGEIVMSGGKGANNGDGGALSLLGGVSQDGVGGSVNIIAGSTAGNAQGGIKLRGGGKYHWSAPANSGAIDLGSASAGSALLINADGSILAAGGATYIDLTTHQGAATLASSSDPATVSGVGLTLESVGASATSGVTVTTATQAGSTAPITIAPGASSGGGAAGSVSIFGGDGGSGGARGGNIVLKPGGAISSGQSVPQLAGAVVVKSDTNDEMLRAGSTGGLQVGGIGDFGVRRLIMAPRAVQYLTSTNPSSPTTVLLSNLFDSTGYALYVLSTKAYDARSPTSDMLPSGAASTSPVPVAFRWSGATSKTGIDGQIITLLVDPGSFTDVLVPSSALGTGAAGGSKVLKKGTSTMFMLWNCAPSYLNRASCLLLPFS